MENEIIKMWDKKIEEMDKFKIDTMESFVNITKSVENMTSTVNVLVLENAEIRKDLETNRKIIEEVKDISIKAVEKVSLMNGDNYGEEWMSQSTIGLQFNPTISSHNVGNILRLTGLAKINTKTTIPYMSTISRGLVKRIGKKDYDSYLWLGDKVVEDFNKYLKKIGKYNEFLAIKDDAEMRAFLSELKK